MSWASAIKEKPAAKASREFVALLKFPAEVIDWNLLVTLDFETYYDADYTLNKLSTSEYIRDDRFKAQMVGIKIGRGATKIYTGAMIATALRAIPWQIYSLLCHNTQFDGFILSHHYGIQPKKIYCTLSMARGLHSNEIGAGLDEVSKFYGRGGKIEGGLEPTKGVLDWSKALVKSAGAYCKNDVEECLGVFKLMVPLMPRDEMDLIDLTVRMFTNPVLHVDLDRVRKELVRELDRRRELLLEIAARCDLNDIALLQTCTKAEKALEGEARTLFLVRKIVGSNARFAALLRAHGVEPPRKISPAWIKKPVEERRDEDKWAYAFAATDPGFVQIPDEPEQFNAGLNPKVKKSAMELAVRSSILRALIDARIAVKSMTNITRAERFLVAGANGMPLPCGYAYFRAHTGRWGGNNKMNMQNLTRGGELRASIVAPAGHQVAVADSGQIEARVNAWLWGQEDLLKAFADNDLGIGKDAYCLFAEIVYGFPVTKANKIERHVGKTCVLGLGYQMGPLKLMLTLAKGANGGPPVYITEREALVIILKYRQMNSRIASGWDRCTAIINQMANGMTGSYKCLRWGKGFIQLPNGMTLKYPDLKQTYNEESGRDEWTYQAGRIRKKIYGGLLCENIVQALSRIIIGTQMLAISRKHRVVMTTHDEVVTCIKTKVAPKAFDFMIATMRTTPGWCAGLPLNAEGGFADNYSK